MQIRLLCWVLCIYLVCLMVSARYAYCDITLKSDIHETVKKFIFIVYQDIKENRKHELKRHFLNITEEGLDQLLRDKNVINPVKKIVYLDTVIVSTDPLIVRAYVREWHEVGQIKHAPKWTDFLFILDGSKGAQWRIIDYRQPGMGED